MRANADALETPPEFTMRRAIKVLEVILPTFARPLERMRAVCVHLLPRSPDVTPALSLFPGVPL